MRTHPDPLTCSTGCFLPSLNVPKALISSDIWFSDGNIVIVAGSAAFKVHRGQLERHSEVFKDMFLVDRASMQGISVCDEDTVNEEGNEIVDGCPRVDIYDVPSDVYHLLVALHDGLYSPFPLLHLLHCGLLDTLQLLLQTTPATSRRSPASSVSHGLPTTGPPRLQTGTDERQQRRTPAVATPRGVYAHAEPRPRARHSRSTPPHSACSPNSGIEKQYLSLHHI